MTETKECNACGDTKPLTEFNKKTAGGQKWKGGYQAQCRECDNDQSRFKGAVRARTAERNGLTRAIGGGSKWAAQSNEWKREQIAEQIEIDIEAGILVRDSEGRVTEIKNCIECEKPLVPGKDWSKSYQEGKVYLHTLCHGKRDRVQQRACDRLGLTNKKSYKQGGLENDWLSLSKEEKKIALTEQRQIDKDNGVDQPTEPDKEIQATAEGIKKVKRVWGKRIRKKLIIRTGLDHVVEGQLDGNFIIGAAPRSGQTRKKENANPRVVYLGRKDPKFWPNNYKGGSTARPILPYFQRVYGGALVGDHPDAYDMRPLLAYMVPLNGRDAEDGVNAALQAVGRTVGTRDEEAWISSQELAYRTFRDYMEKVEGAYCVYDDWAQDILGWHVDEEEAA